MVVKDFAPHQLADWERAPWEDRPEELECVDEVRSAFGSNHLRYMIGHFQQTLIAAMVQRLSAAGKVVPQIRSSWLLAQSSASVRKGRPQPNSAQHLVLIRKMRLQLVSAQPGVRSTS